MELEMEIFSALEKPKMRLFGAATKASSRSFVNVVELIASQYRYLVVIELPHVKCYEGEVEWTVNDDSEVTIEGQIDVGEIFSDVTSSLKRRRVQLCPTEPWAISFHLPGPVEWWTTSVSFTSSTVMELTVRKEIPFDELASTFAVASTYMLTTISPVVTTSAGASTSAVAATSAVASSLGVSSPRVIDIDEMIAELLSTSAVATTSEVASTSAVASSSSPRAIDVDEMIAELFSTSIVATTSAMASTSMVASSSGVNSPREIDVDEMITQWLL